MEPGHEAIYDEFTTLRRTARGLRDALRRRIDEQDAIIVEQTARIDKLQVQIDKLTTEASDE